MAWITTGQRWINMGQVLHVHRDGDEMVVTYAVGLSHGTYPYIQRYTGDEANALEAWLVEQTILEAAETTAEEMALADAAPSSEEPERSVIVVETEA